MDMDAEKEALRERVSRIRTGLTVWVPFFGHLLLKLEPKIVDGKSEIKTAGVTRDKKLLINVEYAKKLSDPEFAGLLCHEVMHPAYLCFERQGTRVAVLQDQTGQRVSVWNVAHDFAINGIIDEMTNTVSQVKLPPNPCLDRKKYDGMSAEEIYDALLKEAKEGGGGGRGGGGTIRLPKDGFGTDDIRPEGDPDGDGSGALSESEKRAMDQSWRVAVCEAAQIHEQQKGRGSLPGQIKKLVEEIIDPKINWVDALSRWVGEHGRRADFTYRRPSRRSEALGEILPSIQKHGVDDIVIGWDTSGSMNGREIEILSEVIGICTDLNMSLRVICVDTEVHSDQSGVESPEDVDIKGGGGSDYNPMFAKLHEEGYQGVVVCFTDGFIGVPAEKPPHIREVLWVLWERDVDPTQGRWGEVMQVDKDGNIVSQSAKAAA